MLIGYHLHQAVQTAMNATPAALQRLPHLLASDRAGRPLHRRHPLPFAFLGLIRGPEPTDAIPAKVAVYEGVFRVRTHRGQMSPKALTVFLCIVPWHGDIDQLVIVPRVGIEKAFRRRIVLSRPCRRLGFGCDSFIIQPILTPKWANQPRRGV